MGSSALSRSDSGTRPRQAPSLEADLQFLSAVRPAPPAGRDKTADILYQKRMSRYQLHTDEVTQDSCSFFRAIHRLSTSTENPCTHQEWRQAICDHLQSSGSCPQLVQRMRSPDTPGNNECLQPAAEILQALIVVWPLRRAPCPDVYAPEGYTHSTRQVHLQQLLSHEDNGTLE
jgi:hypothetical protein